MKLDVPKRVFDAANEVSAIQFQTPTGGRKQIGQIGTRMFCDLPFNLPSYTVLEAQALAEETVAGTMIFVSNEVGGACLAISNGTNFVTCHANVAISST